MLDDRKTYIVVFTLLFTTLPLILTLLLIPFSQFYVRINLTKLNFLIMLALILKSQSFTYLKLSHFTVIYYPLFGYPLLLYAISRGQDNDKKRKKHLLDG